MAIYKGVNKVGGIRKGDAPFGSVYKGRDPVLFSVPDEWKYIEFEVDSSDGSYIIPCSAFCENLNEYALAVYVDGDYYGDYTGTVNYISGTGIQLTGLTGNRSTVKLEPAGEPSAGWGRAFGYYVYDRGCNDEPNKAKLLRMINDPDFAHMESLTSAGDNFRYAQYYECISLINAAAESLPYSVTTVGSGFRAGQYYGCISLTEAAAEVFHDRVDSAGHSFRNQQYYGCTSLQTGSYIHSHHFVELLNANPYNYRSMFYLDNAKPDADNVPRYYTDSSRTATAPVTDLTPEIRKFYLTNRTGIEGYETINDNWK